MDKLHWDSENRRNARPLNFISRKLGRFRYQFIGAVVIAVLLPSLVRWGFDPRNWLIVEQRNTMIGAAGAIFIGMLMLREVESLPEVRGVHYIIPAQLTAFAAVLAVFFFARINYNRFLFPTSFGLSVLWFYYVRILVAPKREPSFLVVPFGDVNSLLAIPKARWTMLENPDLADLQCDGIVVDLRSDLDKTWEAFIADCAIRGWRVFHVKQIRETLTGQVAIEHLSENTLGSLNPRTAYSQIKHLIDWIFALAAGIVLLPVFAIVALAIKLDTKGPVLYRQVRVGYRGKPFSCIKFRTMTHRSLSDGSRHSAITQENDARITRVGKILRRTRIDELPQIVNILRGEMSWIGPRPEAQALSQWYEKELPFYRYRHIVRPGISGWAQVNQGHVAVVDLVLAKLHYDFYYIKNYSLWLDLLIVFRTIYTMVTGFGAR